MKTTEPQKILSVSALARVEGEGGLFIKMDNGKVTSCELKIFEAPRFFESLLIGRNFHEPPDITSRICGICPVAYLISSIAAIEDACQVQIPEYIWNLRRLLYCGEWIESHSLHVFFLHAPGFLGYPSLMEMAKDFPKEAAWALQMKKAGNTLIQKIGGREIHPVNVRIGGFYSFPKKLELRSLLDILKRGLDYSLLALQWIGLKCNFPDFKRNYIYVGLKHPKQYPIERGIICCGDSQFDAKEFEKNFIEEQTTYSNALRWKATDSRSCLAGPLARYHLNYSLLPTFLQEKLKEIGLEYPCHNPFQSILVRLAEIAYAFYEAIRLIEDYEPFSPSFIPFDPNPQTGYGISEAPRGLLYHKYELDDKGSIRKAKIVPPTCFNLASAEDDLKTWIETHSEDSIERMTLDCEQIVRNYDPCISCATHFLKLHFW
ncbi:Ni/Fe hydrogenase subunit alpha [Candidatus Methylacidiphilum fumarolicum]|nr:Ni/Fe hydrogenase subunit alpha [Candidatus Methylacidiphilum fumarolicum]MBW6413923.1 Ni/Fe hydrogenase subunit alpha [Candidatus Methylacidiphilum fumarolicum]TFE70474.1 hydrogenase [Candidatus Methylacidiphilum fumarolicum]TFE74808.1 Ni/Fe hydrogenase subunit alpha [Candidatus Methylacidiphilum fumarolicum]TFE76079.1 Ni/Fe hydrogenase subunit alpha [Candidatus Methylacidiphilum fumarolicum]TFE76362.1 hydrogenase [Candidatus Methylacidiphilum fumarolicum]